jgi:hypothetical protein
MMTNYALLKTRKYLFGLLPVLLACAALLRPNALRAGSVPVRYTEGLVHGFLMLRTLEGNPIADGDFTQVARGERVTDHLVFHFRDGSIYEETTVFSQRGRFRLLSEHRIQKGPAFKRPMETSINASTGQVTVRYTDDDGKEKLLTERLKLPPDVANGVVLTLIKNIQPGVPRTTVSMVAAAPKPRLVKLVISLQDEEPFSIGASNHKAMHYVVKVEIGGAAGLLAPLVGKQPPDIHVWVLGGQAPIVIKSEGPLYEGGPIWRIELAIPVWPQGSGDSSKD